jgi:ribonuclease PH
MKKLLAGENPYYKTDYLDRKHKFMRQDGRSPQELRPITFTIHATELPYGSVICRFGNTHVFCTVSVEQGVPKFITDPQQGWLTAEYRMLPAATNPRQPREWQKLSGRTQEIQRLIGRSLRSALDLRSIPNLTLTVDVDVLQADGGTRTAGITGGFVALVGAIERLQKEGKIIGDPQITSIAGVSVGLIEGVPYLDLNYDEDKIATVDFNVVMNGKGGLIEVQGTGESGDFSRKELNAMLDLAEQGIQELFLKQTQALSSA